MWINSPGGDCVAAAQIYNMLSNYKGKVTVKIDGIAASAASVIAMAGDTVLVSPVSMLMIHNPATIAWGDHAEMQKAIDMLSEVKESIINAYVLKTGLSRPKLSHLMDAETWLNGQDAAEYFNIATTESVAEIAAASGGYVARVHNMPKDLVIQRAAGAAKNKMSDNQDARSAELIQNNKKRDQIARIIINSL